LKETPSIAGFIWPPTINKPIAIPGPWLAQYLIYKCEYHESILISQGVKLPFRFP
jgi:hypothetical protein